MKYRSKESVLGLLMILTGIIMFGLTMTLPNRESQLFDSRFMPFLTAFIMTVLGVLQFLEYRNIEGEEPRPVDNKTLLITIGLLIFYVVFYGRLGFVVTSIIFIFFEILNLTPSYVKKNYILIVALSFVLPIAVYYLFYFGFRIILPAGILRGIL